MFNREKVRGSPDYVGWAPEEAAADFAARVREYESVYQSLDDGSGCDDALSYIKLFNLQSKVHANQM